MIRSTRGRLGGALPILVLGLAACGGGSPSAAVADGSSEAASVRESIVASAPESAGASAAESAASSAAALDVTGAAQDISDLSSYQLDITVKSAADTQTLTIVSTRTPVKASEYTMGGSEPVDLISIEGQGAWLKQGDTWVEPPGGAALYMSVFDFLAPDKLVSNYRLGIYAADFHEVGSEDHNGVPATHYHLEATDISGTAAADFPPDGVFDLWIATDGGYLVGLRFTGTDPESNEAVDMKIEVSRVNDPSIVIEAPI